MEDSEVRLWLNYCLTSKLDKTKKVLNRTLKQMTEEQKQKFLNEIEKCERRFKK